mmetsp:Transcript_115496/g.222539  ORF Transcript_115496/g.222539 Transcript_115496/m.222539 type:complete len:331 (-) Transcript_115496:49-1041(-)
MSLRSEAEDVRVNSHGPLFLNVFEIRYSVEKIQSRLWNNKELFVESLAGLPVLRVGWYNGAYYTVDNEHLYILKSVKLYERVPVQLLLEPVQPYIRSKSHGLTAGIEQTSILEHVCFGKDRSEWVVVSESEDVAQQFRYEGFHPSLASLEQGLRRHHGQKLRITALDIGPGGEWFLAAEGPEGRHPEMAWGNVPATFEHDIKHGKGKILSVAFGCEGWIIRAERNVVWRGLPEALDRQLQDLVANGRLLMWAALGPTGEWFLDSARNSEGEDREVSFDGMSYIFEEALAELEGEFEHVAIAGRDVYVVWGAESVIANGLHHHLSNCPEFN